MLHGRDESVAVLRHRFDEARVGGIVAKLPSERFDALRQCFVGDRHAAPYLREETVLRHQLALVGDQQCERVEIAAVQLDGIAAGLQSAVARVEYETLEGEAFRHFQEDLTLLVPSPGTRASLPSVMHAGSRMASVAKAHAGSGGGRRSNEPLARLAEHTAADSQRPPSNTGSGARTIQPSLVRRGG